MKGYLNSLNCGNKAATSDKWVQRSSSGEVLGLSKHLPTPSLWRVGYVQSVFSLECASVFKSLYAIYAGI